MADLKLGYGATRSLPEGARCAWGARLIWPNDLVWNRQDIVGEEGERSDLTAWLNGGPLEAALTTAHELADRGAITPASNFATVLYEDERGTIVANPQGSYGYLYVGACLKAHI